MRNGMAWLVCVLVLGVGALATWSLTRGQAPADSPGLPPSGASQPAVPTPPGPAPAAGAPAAGDPAPLVPTGPAPGPREGASAEDSGLRKQVENGARRGAEWLCRMNTVKGRFVPGILPSLNAVMEGDDYLHQAGAALALARAARCTGDKTYAARATQAVLSLLDDTVTEADPSRTGAALRHTPLPSSAVNRLAAAGLLIAAVNELPAPQDDLLKKSEELCAFVRARQRPDGSLACEEEGETAAPPDPEAALYPGLALYGLMRSQAHRPAPWKTDCARKALARYAAGWRAHRNMAFVPWQTAAYAEAFLLSREKPFADFVFEMNDWLCGQQYDRIDPRHPEWLGGFMGWSDGKPQAEAPDIASACYAEGLAEACRVARESADLPRHQRYTAALELCLQFLATLQYSDANTQHFAPLYRQRLLVGAFHASHRDGNLRLDYTQHAVCAMMQYVADVAR